MENMYDICEAAVDAKSKRHKKHVSLIWQETENAKTGEEELFWRLYLQHSESSKKVGTC